ncbi:hypothetical protein PspLS_08459 [Pyricularia sp. CBS 133598]|nr:hypothetical protein PspLS_08459 [Pyricularia sp. CBS 133598]
MALIALGGASDPADVSQLQLDQTIKLNDVLNDPNVKIVITGSNPTTVIGKDIAYIHKGQQ